MIALVSPILIRLKIFYTFYTCSLFSTRCGKSKHMHATKIPYWFKYIAISVCMYTAAMSVPIVMLMHALLISQEVHMVCTLTEVIGSRLGSLQFLMLVWLSGSTTCPNMCSSPCFAARFHSYENTV